MCESNQPPSPASEKVNPEVEIEPEPVVVKVKETLDYSPVKKNLDEHTSKEANSYFHSQMRQLAESIKD